MPAILERSFEELVASLPDWEPFDPAISEADVLVSGIGHLHTLGGA